MGDPDSEGSSSKSSLLSVVPETEAVVSISGVSAVIVTVWDVLPMDRVTSRNF
jgi:hypothetical protein